VPQASEEETVRRVEVISYAGYRGEEEPRTLVLAGEPHDVLGIDDRWYDPEARYFRVAVADGHVYLLRHDTFNNRWSIVADRLLDA